MSTPAPAPVPAPRKWRSAFRRRALAPLSAVGLLGLVAVALLADVLASDLPLVVRRSGELHVFPAVFPPPGWQAENLESLRYSLDPLHGDFLLPPPIPYGPRQTSLTHVLEPPGARHWLGTDELGRDVLARLIHGARVSLTVAVFGVGLAVLLGVLLGGWAGLRGGWVDAVVGRLIEVLLAFPTFLLVLCVMGLTRVSSVWPLVLMIGLTRWTEVARLVRAEILRLREAAYVEASVVSGAPMAVVLFRHLVPGALGPVLIAATFALPGAILLESALSFLGFGVPPPTPSWGELLTQAHRYLTHLPQGGTGGGAWWLTLFPGLLLFATAVAFQRVGEVLRDVWAPERR